MRREKWIAVTFTSLVLAAVAVASMLPAANPASAQAREIDRRIAECEGYLSRGSADSLLSVGTAALADAESRYGDTDSTVARLLELIGLAQMYQAKYADSAASLARAVDIRTANNPNHWYLARAFYYSGILHYEVGDYAQAAAFYQNAYDVYNRSTGYPAWRKADCLNSIAATHWVTGNYADAATAFKAALSIYEESVGTDDPNYAGCLNNLALLYHEQGDLVSAEPMYRRAMETLERTRGPEDSDLARLLVNLGDLYSDQRRFEEAEAALKRSLSIREKLFGEDHPDVANALNGLATVYMDERRYDDARPLLERSLAIEEKVRGADAPQLAYPLANLGVVYTHQEKYDLAEAAYARALTIREKTFGPDHIFVSNSLFNRATVYFAQGRFADALADNARSMAIRIKALDKTHPLVGECLDNAASIHYAMGHADSALVCAEQAARIWQKHLMENGRVLAEADALNYSRLLRVAMANYLSFYFGNPSRTPAETQHLAELLLQSKGQVSDETFERQRAIVADADEETAALAAQIAFHKQELAEVFVLGPEVEPEVYHYYADSLSNLIQEKEEELARRSASFRKWRDGKDVTVDKVIARLPKGAALVEYVRYDRVSVKGEATSSYAAITLRKGKAPRIVDMGDAASINEWVTEYRKHFKDVASRGKATEADLLWYRGLARRIYDGLWAPIAGNVAGSDVVLVCPDAALNLISFAGLVDGDGKHLVEHYAIHYLAAARDLVRASHAGTAGKGLLAIGDPNYDSRDAADAQVASMRGGSTDEAAIGSLTASAQAAVRGGVPDCDVLDTDLGRLPGTRREVEVVAKRWKGGDKLVRLGDDASEAAFKHDAPGRRAIHLATHGYYVGSECRHGSDAAATSSENPLLRSGLFLAGANRRLHRDESTQAQPGTEDGVLTALEVSALPLDGCELVVLSACETGLGKPEDGEGVYGLRRAFQMAGARVVVSALWPVGDEDAARFVSELYGAGNEALPQRVRKLQLDAIRRGKKKPELAHPFSWGAFVASGPWE